MQLYLRPFYNILRQQNNFEWTIEHQTRFKEIKKLLNEQISNTIPDASNPNVRCFKFWNRCSIITIPQLKQQNESYISKFSLIYTS